MKVIDISGPIYNGMWNYSDQYPKFKLTSIGFPYGGEVFPVDVFEGFHAQVGTYIESPGIFLEKYKKKLNDVPIENFYKIDAFILQLNYDNLDIKDGRHFASLEDIKKAEKEKIPEGSAILVSTGYGKNWMEDSYVQKSWFLKKEAFYYLIDKKPSILGGDSPVWENDKNPEGAFTRFYESGIMLLAPCINLEQVEKFKVKLIVLPLKVAEASICPVRAVILEN